VRRDHDGAGGNLIPAAHGFISDSRGAQFVRQFEISASHTMLSMVIVLNCTLDGGPI